MNYFPNGNPKLGHEWSETERGAIGRDPREMTVPELAAIGHTKRPLLAVIRQNCIECAGSSQAEARRCPNLQCPFWPFRMGANPFNTRELSDEQRATAAERMRQNMSHAPQQHDKISRENPDAPLPVSRPPPTPLAELSLKGQHTNG